MAKTLKLHGVQTFCGVLTNGTPVLHGDVCVFSDSAAAHLLKGEERNEIGDGIPHWKETNEEPNWDFSGIELPNSAYAVRGGGNVPAKPRIGEEADENGSSSAGPVIEEGGENSNLVDAAARTTQRAAAVQRKGRAAATK